MSFLLGNLHSLPHYVLIAVSPFIFVAIVLASTRLYTTWRYNQSIKQYNALSSSKTQSFRPPQVPYTIPVLGNALEFLAPYPGVFWRTLFKTHPRDTGTCSVLLGGRPTHVLFSPHAVNALFKDRQLQRHTMDRLLISSCFDLSLDQVDAYYAGGGSEEMLNKNFLIKTDRVNELTSTFNRVFSERLEADARTFDPSEPRGLYDWIRDRMFTASTTALMGSHLLQMVPDLCEDFWGFDKEMLSFFFQIPFGMSEAYARREKILTSLEQWDAAMLAQCEDSTAMDPNNEVDWEPLFGSRLNRARRRHYAERGLVKRSRAGLDLGLLFGLSSNAIPATGWMLMHILNPEGDPTLLGRVMEELRTVQRSDGSIDVPALISLPLLLSVHHEVLRLYTDVLVSRDLDRDMVLPLNESGTKTVTLPKNGMIMAPSWLGHHDAGVWSEAAPCEEFYAERFLKRDLDTGKDRFSLDGTSGKLFPFGGGKTQCPGRIFAKQEVLGAVAKLLLDFEFEVLGFMDGKGADTKQFPGLRSSYQGSGIMVAEGDIKVKVRARNRL